MFILDIVLVNVALMIATSVRFEGPFGFPDYAYPLVFIVITVVAGLALISVGEYVEYRPTVRRTFVGLLINFFFLSSLTYFFKEYAFSRGVLLMTIGLSVVMLSAVRGLFALFDATRGSGKTRSIILVGLNDSTKRIMESLQSAERRNASIAGVVSVGTYSEDRFHGAEVLGSTEYLDRILESTKASEVIVTDPAVSQAEAMKMMIRSSQRRARFHLASDYDDIVMARIINDVAGIEPTVSVTPLLRFRNNMVKRLMDILMSIVVVPVLAVRLSLGSKNARDRWSIWTSVLRGESSVVGLYDDGVQRAAGKPGVTGLVHVSKPETLSSHTIKHLNDYYIDHYSVALDVEIMLKHLLRSRG